MAAPPLAALAQQLFAVRPEELKRTALSFVYLFACIGAFVIARITRSVLFLEIPNYKDQLPLTYIAVAIAVSLVMLTYARVERRLRRDRTNTVTLVVLLAVTLAFRWALQDAQQWVYWAFYVWVELFGTFLVVQFWSLTSELYHSRQAKRLFAVIGGGGVLANIAFGFAASEGAKLFGTENLLFAIAGCLVVCLVMVSQLAQDAQVELNAALERPKSSTQASAQSVFATRHVRLIAAVIVLTYVVSTLVDYQFQVIVGDSIAGKDARGAYFGAFFGITGILGGIIQFLFTSRILERFGILVALALLPIGMLTGSVGMLCVPPLNGLMLAGFTKGTENVLRYTINDATLQLLYLPVPGHLRGRAKAFIDGVLKPLSVGAAGLLLALLVGQLEKLIDVPLGLHVEVYTLSWVVSVALVAWLGVTVALKREYVQSLVQTLQHRRLDFAGAQFSISDDSTLQLLGKTLQSSRATDVLHALELITFCDADARGPLDVAVLALLRHPDNEVREAALHYLAAAGSPTLVKNEKGLLELLADPAPGVRAAAAQATCAILGHSAYDAVQPLLNDSAVSVQAAAMVGLIRHAGLDGVLCCAENLKRMLGAEAWEERQRAAWVLGEVGVQNFYQPLVPLLNDPNTAVRLAAVVAAGRLKSNGLLPTLVTRLGDPKLGPSVVNALVSYGDAAMQSITMLLGDTQQPVRQRAMACRVLGKWTSANAADLLQQRLHDAAWQVRGAAGRALAMQLAHSELTVRHTLLQSALRLECQGAFGLLATLHDLQPDAQVMLLKDALEHRLRLAKDRVLVLLGLRHNPRTVDLIARNLSSGQVNTRANALELLDNLLGNEEKAWILPLFDDTPTARVLQQIRPVWPLDGQTRAARLEELLKTPDPWLQTVAAHAVARWRCTDLLPHIRPLLRDADAVCRETAIGVLQTLHGGIQVAGELLTADLMPLTQDPATAVSRYARHVLRLPSA